MTNASATANRTAARAADSDWLARAARIGLAARGVIYLLIALLAVQVARGGAEQADQQGALRTIAEQPFGRTVLWVLAVGLFALAVWRVAEGIWGRQDETDARKRAVKRAGSLCIAVLYLGLAFLAAQTASGGGGGGGAGKQKGLVGRLLELPGGQSLLVAAGLVVVAIAVALAWKGVRSDFEKELNTGQMGPRTYPVVRRLGQAGFVSRGVIFALVGLLVVKAAMDYEPEKATGLDVTLKSIASAPYGPLLLFIAAAGLVCFGVYAFAEARYRRL